MLMDICVSSLFTISMPQVPNSLRSLSCAALLPRRGIFALAQTATKSIAGVTMTEEKNILISRRRAGPNEPKRSSHELVNKQVQH